MPQYHRFHALRIALAAAAAAAVSSRARPAAADHSLQAITTLTTGYTDNVQAVPDNPADPTVTPAVQSDAFANIAPGIVFSHEGVRITQVLRYTLNIRLYAGASGANSFSNNILYGAVVPLTPRAGLTFDLSAGHGRQNAFDTAPQDTPVGGQAQGDQSYAQAATGVGYNYQLTHSWQYQQAIGASIYQPTDDTTQVGRRTAFDASVGLSKSFNFHSFTLSGRGTYSILDTGEDAQGVELEDQKTILLGPELRWVHDLNEDFSTDASVGMTVTFPAGEFERREEFPVGAAYLRYAHDRFAGALGYRRSVTTNIVLGETEATHVAEVRGVVPLPLADKLSLAGAVGYSNGTSIGIVNAAGEEVEGHTIQWVGDISLAWQATEAISAGLRYQRIWQDREDPRLMEIGGTTEEQHTRRQQITLVLEGRYPTRQAVELPKDPSSRVDGGLESMSKREESLLR
ncbi:MAG TPA: hypothetical protein VK698_13695 [Kofleriaceae bacterium]|nr:hypothetical protein [Kofleriaceae bacterium]